MFFFFVYHSLGYRIEMNRHWFWLDKSSKKHELSKNNMAKYISSQEMFQQQDLSLWGNYKNKIYNLGMRSYT